VEYADMTLEVASTNTRAIALYEKLGFLKTREITRWHRVK
jgi:ribosomal protein S18 acetylase RimI-like enzyme